MTTLSQRKSVLDALGDVSQNAYCRLSDLHNEASVESFFLLRLISDLGYKDSQIKTKQSLESLTVARGRKQEKYKPDYALFRQGVPRCIIDAKSVDEDPDDWVEQCSGYCLALNRKYEKNNPVRYFVLSNGLKTVCYEWDRDEPLIILDFSDFIPGNPKYEHLKSVIGQKKLRPLCPNHWCCCNQLALNLVELRLHVLDNYSIHATKPFGNRRDMVLAQRF